MVFKSIVSAFLIGLLITSVFSSKVTPEEIMETVIVVENSSGIVVHSDGEKSLILTCYHVIDQAITEDRDINVMFLYMVNGEVFAETFVAQNIQVDESKDLALLEINPGRILPHSKIAEPDDYPELGDDIWTGSNPNRRYRSIKKGIVSSKQRYVDNILTWELSGGIVFGSSGGGAFTSDGKLFGIIRAVEPLLAGCWEEETEEGDTVNKCLVIPVYHMGYVVSPEEITDFILTGEYAEYFDYLR